MCRSGTTAGSSAPACFCWTAALQPQPDLNSTCMLPSHPAHKISHRCSHQTGRHMPMRFPVTPADASRRLLLLLLPHHPRRCRYYDVVVGKGEEAVEGKRVVVHYECKHRGVTFITSRWAGCLLPGCHTDKTTAHAEVCGLVHSYTRFASPRFILKLCPPCRSCGVPNQPPPQARHGRDGRLAARV